MIVHEDNLTGGFGAEVAAIVAQEAFEHLDAPVTRVAAIDTPIPFTPVLEHEYLPTEDDILRAARELAATVRPAGRTSVVKPRLGVPRPGEAACASRHIIEQPMEGLPGAPKLAVSSQAFHRADRAGAGSAGSRRRARSAPARAGTRCPRWTAGWPAAPPAPPPPTAPSWRRHEGGDDSWRRAPTCSGRLQPATPRTLAPRRRWPSALPVALCRSAAASSPGQSPAGPFLAAAVEHRGRCPAAAG